MNKRRLLQVGKRLQLTARAVLCALAARSAPARQVDVSVIDGDRVRMRRRITVGPARGRRSPKTTIIDSMISVSTMRAGQHATDMLNRCKPGFDSASRSLRRGRSRSSRNCVFDRNQPSAQRVANSRRRSDSEAAKKERNRRRPNTRPPILRRIFRWVPGWARSVSVGVAPAVERPGLEGHPWPSRLEQRRSIGRPKRLALPGHALRFGSLCPGSSSKRRIDRAPALEPQDVRVSVQSGRAKRSTYPPNGRHPACPSPYSSMTATPHRCGLHVSVIMLGHRVFVYRHCRRVVPGDRRSCTVVSFRKAHDIQRGAHAGRADGPVLSAVGRKKVAWIRIMSP